MRGLVLLLTPFITTGAMACQLTIVYSDVAAPPYLVGDGATIPAAPGIAIELVSEAARQMDCKITWKRLPNRRVQHAMQYGDADAMLMYSYDAERATYAVYPMKNGAPDRNFRLATLSYYIYTKVGSPLAWDGKQFTNLAGTLGVNAGYSVGGVLQKMQLPVEEARSTEQNLNKLQMDRIAAYVMQDMPVEKAIEDSNIKGVQKLPLPFSTKDYFLAFSVRQVQSEPAISTRLWEQIAKTPKARLQDLHSKYRGMP